MILNLVLDELKRMEIGKLKKVHSIKSIYQADRYSGLFFFSFLSARPCRPGTGVCEEHEVNKLLETIISIGFGSKMSTNVKRVSKHPDQTHYPRLLTKHWPFFKNARDGAAI